MSHAPRCRARLATTANGYQLTDESDNVETYDGSGKLLSRCCVLLYQRKFGAP
jgi:hypothetical protein